MLVGDDTALDLAGSVDLVKQGLSLQAYGAANLAVLQGFVPDVRSSGRADVSALIGGTAVRPIVSGQALLTDGRLRHFSFPHALEDLNGIVTFNASGIRLDDPGFTTALNGRSGGGTVKFGGRIGLTGYELSEFDVTATGPTCACAFPRECVRWSMPRSRCRGRPTPPLLSGTVTVRNASWTRGFSSATGVFALRRRDRGSADGNGCDCRVVVGAAALRRPDRCAVDAAHRERPRRALSPAPTSTSAARSTGRCCSAAPTSSAARCGSRAAAIRSPAAALDFTNPNRIQPFFDVEAETRVRVPGQTYRVTLRLAGTTDRMQPEFTSDPPLAPIDVLTLLFSDTAPTG